MILWNNTNPTSSGFAFHLAGKASPSRAEMLDRVMAKPLWTEDDLAILLDVGIDAVRHMKSKGRIFGVVNVNLRKWFVHRDAFLEHVKLRGMPKASTGRPRGSATDP